MYKICILLCSFWFISATISCDNEDDLNTDPNFRLNFSVDTLSFDTLFTGFGSTTRQFKVYNNSAEKVNISRIWFQDSDSPYRLNVNGTMGGNFTDIEINAGDSLFVFAEVNLQATDTDEPRLLEDILIFEINDYLQGVVLSTWAQDVVLIDADIENSQSWTGKRPYLVEKQVAVVEDITLTLEEGTRVYFYKNAGLDIYGEMNALGSFEKPIYFGSSRLEDLYKNVPGQWNGIYFHEASKDNILKHFKLKNGINGISCTGHETGANTIKIEYGEINNFTDNGVFVSNASLLAHDVLITNCGDECLLLENGDLQLYQSTLYNTWFFNVRTAPVIRLLMTDTGSVEVGNCIVWGSRNEEFESNSTSGIIVENSLLKLSNSIQQEYATVFTNCLFNDAPGFANVEELNFTLSENSPCINLGKKEFGTLYPIDLCGNSRNTDDAPDLGAYEFYEKKE